MITRRAFIAASVLAGALVLLPRKGSVRRVFARSVIGGSLNPATITKYMMPLVVPPAMPHASKIGHVDYYEIAVRQFKQQILPAGMPPTTVWGYGSVRHPGTFHYPAFTIEADFHKPVRIKWINDLKDTRGNFLPHLLPVDPTLHWANPPGGLEGRDSRPTFSSTPSPYAGPVPLCTHLHGGHNAQESDGYPEAWFLPAGAEIPHGGYAREGSWYRAFREKFRSKFGVEWEPGTATFQYENDQRATTLWYHDHTLGMTRLNVYAGPVGFYLIRNGPSDLPAGVLPGPAPDVGADPFGRYYEIPLVIQDRSFNADGSLFYPDTRAFFDEFGGPYIPHSDVPPIWNPEFFGNTIVVNGRTWPALYVEPRRYRFRCLNGCNSRFLILKMVTNSLATRPATEALPFWQIGADGGFLPAPTELPQLLLAPAERADVLVDFTGVPVGTEIYLINEAPDEPFGGGVVERDFPAADPMTTGQVMKFVVGPLVSKDQSHHPKHLSLPAFMPLGDTSHLRQVSLNEEESEFPGFDGPVAAFLGILDDANEPIALDWHEKITENPDLDSVEIWELYNVTEDAHPIHLHQVQFQVVDRQAIDGGTVRPAESWEKGFKDTVVAYPGEITRLKARFDLPGLYVWHCHILEHEDNEMMRPYFVGPTHPVEKPRGRRTRKSARHKHHRH